MVFAQLELGVFAYVRRVGRLVLCLVAAAAAGFAVHHLAADLRAGVRLAATMGTMLGVGLALLGLYEGFSPRAILRSLRG
jgi:hypothetical protein